MSPLRVVSAAAACVALVLLSGCTAAAPAVVPDAARAAGIQPSIIVGGASVPFTGLQRWASASVPGLDSRELTVFATGSNGGSDDRFFGRPCGPPLLRLHVAETPRTVTVTVAGYQQPAAPDQACPGSLTLPSPHPVELRQPLGSREVIDAATGKHVAVLDGSRYPDIPAAPRAWGASLIQNVFPAYPPGVVTRRWTLDARQDRSLYLESEAPRQVRAAPPSGALVQRLELRGVPAVVYRDQRGHDTVVQWTPNPAQTVTLHLQDARSSRWTVADAIRWARAVTGYRVATTGRLAQPGTPGTVEATFNSADGPVEEVLELLESSTVYVGLDCEGAGSVQVTARGAIEPFACTGRLSHHLVVRHGVPHLQFPVTVHATPGVRWALTLAVASLDGS